MNQFQSASEIPDKIAVKLTYDNGKPECIRYTRYGNMLAAGMQRSEIVLWDVDAQSIAAVLGAQSATLTRAATSVSFPFPRTGVTVLASYDDGYVRFWDTLAKNMVAEIRFGVSIASAEPHPKHTNLAVIVPKDDAVPILVELKTGWYEYNKSSKLFSVGTRSPDVPKGRQEEADRHRLARPIIPPPILLPPEASSLRCCELRPDARRKSSDKGIKYFVKWSHDGTKLIRASSTGLIDTFALDADKVTMKHISRCALEARGIQIESVCITHSGNQMLITCSDKTHRLMYTEELMCREGSLGPSKPRIVQPVFAFKDMIDNLQWKCSTISGDGKIVAASSKDSDQKILLWNAETGMIKCTLEGPLQKITGMAWHPRKCAMATICSTGGIHLWERNVTENWSAFASDFTELEANEEYDENELEFDLPNKEDELDKAKAVEEEEKQMEVDILGKKNKKRKFKAPVHGEEESDDEEAPYFFVPANPVDPYYLRVEVQEALKQAQIENNYNEANGARRKRTRPNGGPCTNGTADSNSNTNSDSNGSSGNQGDAASSALSSDTMVNGIGHTLPNGGTIEDQEDGDENSEAALNYV